MLAPHELIHVIAFRLIKKRYEYHFGDARVGIVDPLTRPERLFTLALPLITWGAMTLISYTILAVATVFWLRQNPSVATPPLWYLVIGAWCFIPLFYMLTCWADFWQIVWLLTHKETNQPDHYRPQQSPQR